MIGKLCFDISANIIMLIVLLYNIRRISAENNRDRIYFALVFVVFISNVAEIVSTVMLFTGRVDFETQMILTSIEGLVFSLLAPFYLLYMIIFTGNEQKFYENKKLCVFLSVPAFVELVYLLAYYFKIIMTGSSFEGVFLEKFHDGFLMVPVFFYAVVGLMYLYSIRKAISRTTRVVLPIPIVLVTLSLVLRMKYPETQSVFFTTSMCFLLLLLLNRASTALIDVNTRFRTRTAFADDMKAAQYINREFKLILIRIINYSNALNRSGYDVLNSAVIQMSKSISRCINDNLISGDVRYYDEEGSFIIAVPPKHFDKAEMLARDISKNIMDGVGMGSLDFKLMANICIVSFPQEAQDVDTVLLLLDDLGQMNHSLRILTANDFTSSEDFEIRKQMNSIIDRAEKEGNFSVYYQPIYDMKKKCFRSAEALIRLKDPEHGFISPAVFIPIAEKTGAIHKIGSFVLEEVMKFIASDEFKELGIDYIEINLSGAQCLRVNLTDEILTLAEKYHVNPSNVNLEITETAECYSQDILQDNIRSLHNAGYSFSLDDFGTGYSNLMRMAALPLEIIKLDRAFVLMDDNEKFHSIIKNMVHLFRQMGLKILVEGVETEQMVEKFTDIDVDYIQGYYFSRPLPKDEYTAFLRSHLK